MPHAPQHLPSAAAIASAEAQDAADPSVLVAREAVPNFGVERFRLEEYAECTGSGGCYWADVKAQTERAEKALDEAIASGKRGERLALVLDIDETSLSSYCEMKREDFGYIPAMSNEWVVSPAASVPLPETLQLFRKAKAAGIAVFFITGRPYEQREATARNLERAGYSGWTGLALRDEAEKKMSTVAYKSSERQKIVARGYRIVMSVGDQWSDLDGEPRAAISVKLPNPFYYIP